jgi:hypothetical protein
LALSTATSMSDLGNTVFGGGGQKFASIDQSGAAAATVIVAAVTGARIRILAAVLTGVGSSITVTLLSDATQLTGEITGATNLNAILPFNPAGWVQTEAGEAFKITSTNGAVNGCIVYEEIAG